MAIALLSLRQAEKVEPQLRAALKGQPATAKPTASDLAQAGLSARERLALRDGSPADAAAALNARQYVQQIIAKDREFTRSQMIWALGRIEPGEIEAMLKSLAKMRGRYASLVLEYSQTERPIGRQALEELRGLRERIDEFERGLETIKTAILDGNAEVDGVKAARI